MMITYVSDYAQKKKYPPIDSFFAYVCVWGNKLQAIKLIDNILYITLIDRTSEDVKIKAFY